MTTEYIVTNIDNVGRIHCKTITNGEPHRKVLVPGDFNADGTFIPTDVTNEPQVFKDAALLTWTTEVVDAYKLAVPYVAPTPPTPEQLKQAAVRANNRRKAMVTAIQNSDDAQLIAAIGARYPALSGDALKAVVDLALLIAGVIRD